MLVEIDKSIFEEQSFSDINSLIRILSWRGRYEMFIDIVAVAHLDLYQRLDVDDKSNIELQYNKYVIESRKPNLCISTNDKKDFILAEAILFLQQPVTLLLENSSNDSPFVKAIIKCFDKKGIINKHLVNNWLKFGNAGGKTNFQNYLYGELRAFRKYPKDNNNYLRHFVLLDSDRIFPEMELKEKSLINFLKDNEIAYHILEKREMENYLPEEAIDTIQDSRDFIDAYLRLNPIQKDFFDLENGFKKPFKNLIPGLKDLYKDIDSATEVIFKKKNLTNLYKAKKMSFKSGFPKLFHNKTVTKQTLLKRCAHHHSSDPTIHPYNPKELPDLVEAIAKLL